MEEDSDGYNVAYYDPYGQYNSTFRNGNVQYANYQMPVYQEYTPYYPEYDSFSPPRNPFGNGVSKNRNMPNPTAVEFIPEAQIEIDDQKPPEPEEDIHEESPFALHHITRQEVFSDEVQLDSDSSQTVSPFENQRLGPQDIPEFQLPKVFLRKDPIFPASLLVNFSLGTLFYMFYGNPKEKVQAEAAAELYRRQWKYCTENQTWYHFLDSEAWDLPSWTTKKLPFPTGKCLSNEDIRVRKV